MTFYSKIIGFTLSCILFGTHATSFAQADCSNIIINGDFESGGSGWNSTATATLGVTEPPLLMSGETLINSNMPRNGTLSAELGGYGGTPPILPGYGPPFKTSIRKSVVTLAVSESLTLKFWLKFDACFNSNDILEVVATANMSETILLSFDGGNPACGNGLWQEYTVDLSAFKGEVLEIKFRTIEYGANSGQFTRFYLDDVEVEECMMAPPECPSSQVVIGVIPAGEHEYETDGAILGLNCIIQPGAIVDMDYGTTIDIPQNFEIQLGAEVFIFKDGCNGTGGIVNPLGSENEDSFEHD